MNRISYNFILISFIIAFSTLESHAQTSQLKGFNEFDKEGIEREISLFANGKVLSILDAPSDVSTATGSLGFSIQYPNFFSNLQVSAMGTDPKISDSFGSAILSARGGGVFSGFGAGFRYFHFPINQIKLGVHSYFNASSSKWIYNDLEYGAGIREIGFHISSIYEDSFGNDDNNPISIIFDIGFARRSIVGNISNSNNQNIRESILGTTKTSFPGFELGVTLQMHQITARGAYLHFGGDIDGFSNGQIMTTISVKSAIFTDTRMRVRN